MNQRTSHPKAMSLIINQRTCRPNVVVAKKQRKDPHPEKCLITSHRLAMSRSLLNKRHSQHGAQLTGNFTLSHDPTLKSSTWRPTSGFFQKPTGFQSVHVLDFKSTYMAPNVQGASCQKKRDLRSPTTQ